MTPKNVSPESKGREHRGGSCVCTAELDCCSERGVDLGRIRRTVHTHTHTWRCKSQGVGWGSLWRRVCVERGQKGFWTNTELLTVSFGSGDVWRGLWAYCMKLATRGGWRRPLDAIYGRDSAREDNTRGRYCVL